MKRVLSPKLNVIISSIILVFFLTAIFLNETAIVTFFTETLTPLAKILLIALGLISYGLLGAYAKAREAGFSGQYNKRPALFWKPLVVETSFKGALRILSTLLQLFVFASLLYLIGGYYLRAVIAYANGTYDPEQYGGGTLFYLPVFIFIVVGIAYSLKFLENIGFLKKGDAQNQKKG